MARKTSTLIKRQLLSQNYFHKSVAQMEPQDVPSPFQTRPSIVVVAVYFGLSAVPTISVVI